MGLKTFHYLLIIIMGLSGFIGYAVRDVEANWQQQNNDVKIAHAGDDCRRDYQIGAK